MSESAKLNISSLSVPAAELTGLSAWEQIEKLCRIARNRLLQLLESPLTPDDQTCLLNYIETMALELINKPMRVGFRDTSGAGKNRREFESRIVALAIGNKGRLPFDITGFRDGLNTPTPLAKALVEIVTAWNSLTELREGLRLLHRHRRSPKHLSVEGKEVALHIHFSAIGDQLISPRTRTDLEPRATKWEEGWDSTDYINRAYAALDAENGASLLGVLASSRMLLHQANQRGVKTTFIVDTLLSHKKVLVEDLHRAGIPMRHRDAHRFFDQIFDRWRAEFGRIWREVEESHLCPVVSPLPCFLPVIDKELAKCLRMPASTQEFGLQMLYRQLRLQDGLQTKEARAASQALVRAASRDLARFQARLLWPDFPDGSNFWTNDSVCVGTEEKKNVLGVRPESELDLYVFDRTRRTIVIGEVKVARFACTIGELSREYDNFGRRGLHRTQLARKLRWARQNRSRFELPWGGSAMGWRVEGAVVTNAFPESVWALHTDLPGIAPVGSKRVHSLLAPSIQAPTGQ